MDNIKFSIIIPSYNGEKYLKECLDSVLSQTYAPYEIIVMNDGSTDSTEDIVKGYMDAESNNNSSIIKYYKHDNVGLGATRNLGIDNASGDYCIFLDSDDFLEPTTLQCCSDRIIKDNPDMVHFEFKNYYDDGRINYVLYNKHLLTKDYLTGEDSTLLLKNIFYFSTTSAYRLDLIKDNNIKFGEGYFFEDHIFFVKAVALSQSISIIHAPFYFYRRHENAITSAEKGKAGHVEGRKRVIMDTYKQISELMLNEQAKSEIIQHHYMGFLTTYLKNTSKENEKEFLTWFVDYMSNIKLMYLDLDDKNFLHIYNKGWFKKKKYKKIDSYIRSVDEKKKKDKEKKRIEKEKADLKKKDYQFVVSEAQRDIYEDTIMFVTVENDLSGKLYSEFLQFKDNNENKKVLFAYKGTDYGDDLILRNSKEYLSFLGRSSQIITDDLNISIRKVRDDQKWTYYVGANNHMTNLFCSSTEGLPEDKYKLRKREYDRSRRYDQFVVQNEQQKNEIVKSHFICESIIVYHL